MDWKPIGHETRPIAEHFANAFVDGVVRNLEHGRYRTISTARKDAAQLCHIPITPGSEQAKHVDEAVEAGVVRAARQLITRAESPQQAWDYLVRLHDHQPTLSVRSSTSMAQQAYSTPLPIAYLAASLAGINRETSVYEPTAGHGALLATTDPGQVTVNELNPDRAADLRAQGYQVTERDAAAYKPDRLHDVVIANPPFGSIQENNGGKKRFRQSMGSRVFETTQIDQAIALKALEAMRPDGNAVLILGGKLGTDVNARSDRYNSRETRGFYYTLYQHYKVNDHFTIWGDLYRKQGAGFPIDVIVIEGRGRSDRSLPAVDVPRIYTSFGDLGVLLNDVLLARPERLGNPGRTRVAGRLGARDGSGLAQSEAVSGVTGAAGGLVDRNLDAGFRDDRAGDADPVRQRPAVVGAGAVYAESSGPHRDAGRIARVAASLGASDRSLERDNPRETGPAGSGIPGASDNGPERATHSTGPVRDPADPGTDAGRVADRSGETAPLTSEPGPAQQVPYQPHSKGQSVNTQVPVNMQKAVTSALDRLVMQVGPLDAYVADRLQYGSTSTLHTYFSAEQVDALGLAINNFEKEAGFIIGDQTGIGKGRVVAGLIRYAKITGRTPIFVTKDPTLYADMIRDLTDIGMTNFNPFVTNNKMAPLPLPDGRVLKTSSSTHALTMREMRQSGELGAYDAIFTTYSQMQTVRGQETPRREFLREFAPGSIVVLDESHEAGGDGGDKDRAQENKAPNRADFARELISLADGVLYSSATYAKRPNVMDLYARTDMKLAVQNMGALAELVERGGVPMQQALATMLTEAGQYIRRERSFEGVSFSPEIAPVNQETAEKMAQIMGRILAFDTLKQKSIKGMDKELKAEAKAVAGDSSVGYAGATSTNFTSVMHNLVSQMLLSLKAEATVQKSLDLLRQPEPEKPVIALSSTMGSFIGQYADLQDLRPGDTLEADFGDLLLRYLERSRDVIIGDPYGQKERKRLSDAELGPEAVEEYRAIRALIAETDVSDIPISPIDHITNRLQAEGYQVREITGREDIVRYHPDGQATYERRSSSERNKAAAIKNVAAFNKGEVDVIILNRSGSTGISLHASSKFADQRPRHMLVVQPELDINLFMQTLGRIHRTGQVVPPSFTLLLADIPAEKRPGAVLARKMASLNANTTAARSSGVSMDEIPDFMNQYGDRVVAELMQAHPDVHARLGHPLSGQEESLEQEDAIRRVTGRIPVLSLKEQDWLYGKIEADYKELLTQLEAMGESELEAQYLPLDARPIGQMEVVSADPQSTSPFTDAVFMEVVNAKMLRKPHRTLDVINIVRDALGLPAVDSLEEHDLTAIADLSQAAAGRQMAEVYTQVDVFKNHLRETANPAREARLTANLSNQTAFLEKTLQEFPAGQGVKVSRPGSDNLELGVIGKVWRTGDDKVNPVRESIWKMRILLTTPTREVTIPLSKLNKGNDASLYVQPVEPEEVPEIYQAFDANRTKAREERQIFTGNLLRAYEQFSGKVVNFTDCYGRIHTGLLTSKEFDINRTLDIQPVRMRSTAEALMVLREGLGNGHLSTTDLLLTLQPKNDGADFLLTAPRSKAVGGRYYLNQNVLDATGADFYSVSDRMECQFPADRLEAVVTAIMEGNHWDLAVTEEKDQVRDRLGVSVPTLVDALKSGSKLAAPPPPPIEETQEPATVAEPRQTQRPEPVSNPKPRQTDQVQPSEPIQINARPSEEKQPAAADAKAIARIAPRNHQKGTAEKNVAALLEDAGLAGNLMREKDFHLKIENDPYIPLVIERHEDEVMLTHYLSQNGDTFIDSEMVFTLHQDGRLVLKDTAVQGIGGEYRGYDRGYAKMFSRNLLEQGFAEAARLQKTPQAATEQSKPIIPAVPVQKDSLGLGDIEEQAALFDLETFHKPTIQPPRSRKQPTFSGQKPSQKSIPGLTSPSVQTETVSPLVIAAQVHQDMDPDADAYLAGETTSNQPSSPTLGMLRVWYRAARDTGCAPDQLDSIAAHGKAKAVYQANGNSSDIILSDEDSATMQRDIKAYEPFVQRATSIKQAALLILGKVGQQAGNGKTTYAGKRYELEQHGESLVVRRKEAGQTRTIVQMQGDAIFQAAAVGEDLERFSGFVKWLEGRTVTAEAER